MFQEIAVATFSERYDFKLMRQQNNIGAFKCRFPLRYGGKAAMFS